MPNQAEIIRERTSAMETEGSAMFDYRLPFSGTEIMSIKGINSDPAVNECIEYLLKLAFANPLRPIEEFEKHLKGYHLQNL